MRTGSCRLVGWLVGALACAATGAHAEGWEEPRQLAAKQLLGASAVQGKYHSIEPAVENDGLMNRYVVASSFQRIGAYGDTLALERAHEQEAMAALRQIKTTDAYQQGLKAAAQAPLALTKKAFTDPVGVVKSVPGAVGNLVSDVSSAIGGLARGLGGDASTTDTLKQLIGYRRVKGRLAHQMGVDAYSSNTVLQTDLDDVAWAVFAGSASIDLVLTQAPIAASLAMTAAKHMHAARSGLWEVPPATLLQASSNAFQSAGLTEDEADRVAWHSSCTVTHQSYLASAVAELKGVAGRDAFARHAVSADDEDDCRRHVETARLLWSYHNQRRPITSIHVDDGVVTLTDADGRAVLPLRADYVFWTRDAGRLVGALPGSGKRAVWLSGVASQRTRAALAQRGIALHERVFARHPREIDVARVLVPKRTVETPPSSAAADDRAPAE